MATDPSTRGDVFTVSGRVIDTAGAPVEGVIVEAIDADLLFDDAVGRAVTDAHGGYRIEFPAGGFRSVLDARPDLLMVAHDATGRRRLAVVTLERNARGRTLMAPPLFVEDATSGAWLVQSRTAHPLRFTHGNDLEFLIDGASLAKALVDAFDAAETSIAVSQLMFKESFPASFGPGAESREPARFLIDAVVDAARRGVDVQVLLNQNTVLPDDAREVAAYVAERGAAAARVKPFPMSPGTLHAKVAIVDGREAFVIGSPFQPRFWDTRDHRAKDPRRGASDPSTHDVSVRVRGPAVRDLAAGFARLWHADADEAASTVPVPDAPPPRSGRARQPGDTSLQVLHTLPPGRVPSVPTGEHHILDAYTRAIAKATSFVYLENQYFTDDGIVDSLRRALDATPDLGVVIVLNENVDLPTYVEWQEKNLRALGHGSDPRVGAFKLTTAPVDGTSDDAGAIYVHSKVAIVDDVWATLGSANLDGFSLSGPSAFGASTEPSVETNLVIADGIEDAPSSGTVRRLRVDLWQEHLGIDARAIDLPGGRALVDAWQEVAVANADALAHGGARRGFVVPYAPAGPLQRLLP